MHGEWRQWPGLIIPAPVIGHAHTPRPQRKPLVRFAKSPRFHDLPAQVSNFSKLGNCDDEIIDTINMTFHFVTRYHCRDTIWCAHINQVPGLQRNSVPITTNGFRRAPNMDQACFLALFCRFLIQILLASSVLDARPAHRMQRVQAQIGQSPSLSQGRPISFALF